MQSSATWGFGKNNSCKGPRASRTKVQTCLDYVFQVNIWSLVQHVQGLKASWFSLKTYITIHKMGGPPYLLSKLVHVSLNICTPRTIPPAHCQAGWQAGEHPRVNLLGFGERRRSLSHCSTLRPCGMSRNWGAESNKGSL